MRRVTLVILLVLPLYLSCTKVYNETSKTPTSPTQTTKVPDKIEFRVFGIQLFQPVVIKHTDPINGLSLYSGGVPYLATISSKDESIFLFIDASGTGQSNTSNLQVQIFVNGKLFREAFSQGFTVAASASGTYRRE